MDGRILLLNELYAEVLSKLPRIDTSKNYWFFRANGGTYYHSFHIGNYIAIGWNFISLQDLKELSKDQVKRKLEEFDKNISNPGSAYNQMLKFANSIKIGDFVIVPSKAPNNLIVGKVVSEPYTESEWRIDSESNYCPYNKRIQVDWLGVIENKDIDSKLYKLVYSGHTISDANQYKKYINRGLYDAYIDGNRMSVTFKVQEEMNIDAFAYSTFLHKTLTMSQILQEGLDKHNEIILRTNVQSNGIIELLGNPEILCPIATVLTLSICGIYFGSAVKKHGGKLDVDVKSGKLSSSINSEGDDALKKAKARKINADANKINADANKINAETILRLTEAGVSPELLSTFAALSLRAPEQVSKITDNRVDLSGQLEFEERDE